MKNIGHFYKSKKVFITGHTGFKGSWLIKILSDFGANIRGYSLAPENEINLYNEINGDSICESIIGDIRDKKKFIDSIIEFQPDYIFHLAAQPLVRKSYEIPTDTFEINAIGTANLLDGIRLLDKQCQIILITTDKVYHNNEWIYPYRENDKLGGYDPYSASKACSELIIDSYVNSFFNKKIFNVHKKSIAICRAGNVIGGGDWSQDRLIPDIIKSLNHQKNIIIRNPNSIRPWQHVIEPLYGYLKLGTKLNEDPIKYSNAYNFGPNISDSMAVQEVVEESIKLWGGGSYSQELNSEQPHEAGILKLDISKAINDLNWQPMMNSSKAIERTINFYKNYYDGQSTNDLMIADINFYESLFNKN